MRWWFYFFCEINNFVVVVVEFCNCVVRFGNSRFFFNRKCVLVIIEVNYIIVFWVIDMVIEYSSVLFLVIGVL